jgi:hypothetical protein
MGSFIGIQESNIVFSGCEIMFVMSVVMGSPSLRMIVQMRRTIPYQWFATRNVSAERVLKGPCAKPITNGIVNFGIDPLRTRVHTLKWP